MGKRPLFCALVLCAVVCTSSAAQADDKAKALSCQIAGITAVKADAKIFDRGSGGSAIAKLTGAKLPLSITHFPNPLKGRVEIATSHGNKNVRIEGWVDKASVRLFAARDLSAVGSHVWITKGQELNLTGASASGFTAKHKVLGSTDAPLTVKLPCDGATLAFPTIEPAEPPKRARTYQMKKDSLELFDSAGGKVVYTLNMEEGTRKVFWSTETRGGYIHVVSRGDITIDGWVRYGDVTFLRHAELFDLNAIAPRPFKERKLKIPDPPAVVVVDSEMPIHGKPENSPTLIGFIEPGARIYPMEVSGAWTNVMPESLAVLPPDGGGFWVRTAGLKKK